MTDKNIYKLPETYTISYFNESEWNKGLTPEEITKNSEIAELQYQDNLLHGPQFGPGNSDSKEANYIGKKMVSGTSSVLLGPLGIPVGIGLKATGEAVKGFNMIQQLITEFALKNPNSDEERKKLILEIIEKNYVQNGDKSNFVKWMDELGEDLIKSGAGSAIGMTASETSGFLGKTFSSVDKVYEFCSEVEGEVDKAYLTSHFLHTSLGIKYESDCKVCKE